MGKLDVAIEGPKSGDNLVLHVLNALYFALHAHPSANSDVQVPRVRDYQVLLSKISSANLTPFIILKNLEVHQCKGKKVQFLLSKLPEKGFFFLTSHVFLFD